MDRAYIRVIICDVLLFSGSDDNTKVAVGTSLELAGYRLSICFSSLIEVLEVFAG